MPKGARKRTGTVSSYAHAHDGRYSNNGWLMELPDPMTRVSWENPIIISPKTAAEWDVISDDAVWLYANGKKMWGPGFTSCPAIPMTP